MSQPFEASHSPPTTSSAPKGPWRPPASRALIAVVVCLCLGAVIVWWRAGRHADAERARAQGWVEGRVAILETSLSRAFSGAEAMAMLVRRANGRLADFQSLGNELLPSRPGLVSLELQPGGITTDVFPRAGNERAMGSNITRDPAVLTAFQSRQGAAVGPVTLVRGQAGIVVRWPVFLRDAKGKESFWGLVSGSVALSDMVSQAGLEELTAKGYDYTLYAVPPPPLKPVPIAHRGNPALTDGVQHSITVANLEFRLTMRPRGGWTRRSSVVLESAAVAVVAGLLALFLQGREQSDQLRARLSESAAHIARERELATHVAGQLQSVKAAGAAELLSAKQTEEGLRAKLLEAESRSAQVADQLKALRTAGATEVASARRAAEDLRAKLIAAESQSRLAQERGDSLQEELRAAKETQGTEMNAANETAAALRVTLRETAAQLQVSREQTARTAEELRLAQERDNHLQEELRAAKDAQGSELNSANEAAAALRVTLRETTAQLQLSREQTARAAEDLRLAQERGDRLQEDLRVAKETQAPDVNPAKEAAGLLRVTLRETAAQLQLSREQTARTAEELRLAQERGDRLQEDLRVTKETQASDLNAAKETAAALRATLRETAAQLQLSREQTARTAEELRIVRAKAEAAELAHAELSARLEARKPSPVADVTPPKLETPFGEAKADESFTPLAITDSGAIAPALKRQPEAMPVPAEGEAEPIAPREIEVTEAAAAQAEPVPPPPADDGEPLKERPAVELTDARAAIAEPPPAPAVDAGEPLEPREVEAGDAPVEPGAQPESEPPAVTKPERAARRKKTEDHAQLSLFGAESVEEEEAGEAAVPQPEVESKPRTTRKPAHAPPEEASKAAPVPALNRTVFKKTAGELYVLLAESDPGAKECLADYRRELRPGFAPEAFEAFEKHVHAQAFHEALELLVKAARRQGINL